MTPREAEQKAILDHMGAVGTIIRPEWIYGYEGDTDNSIDIHANGRVAVRVEPCGFPDDIRHWNDDWLDPYWDVAIVDDPDGICANVRSPWTFGPSYNVKTGEQE